MANSFSKVLVWREGKLLLREYSVRELPVSARVVSPEHQRTSRHTDDTECLQQPVRNNSTCWPLSCWTSPCISDSRCWQSWYLWASTSSSSIAAAVSVEKGEVIACLITIVMMNVFTQKCVFWDPKSALIRGQHSVCLLLPPQHLHWNRQTFS